MDDNEKLNIIGKVLGSISDEQWAAMAKGVLRKVASGEAETSVETQAFAREVLEDMERDKHESVD